MVILNSNQQQIIGWLSAVPSGGNTGGTSATTTSTLSTSLFAVWNGDTTGVSLDTSIYGVWNADTSSTVTTLNTNVYSAYNGENTLNDVVNSRNLTVGAGSVTYGTGKVGTNCFTLTAGQLNLPTNSMQFSGSFSYGMWIKYTGSVPQYNQIFTATGNQSKYGYYLYKYGTDFYLRFGDGTTSGANEPRVWLTVANNITVNTWFHIVVVFNAGSNAQIYKDGQLLHSVNHTMASVLYDTTRPNPIIGNNPGGGTDGPMTGQLDAITFWDKGLTYAEVAALYNEGNGLQYSFPSSVTAYVPSPNDAVGTNHGTLMNGCTFTTGKIGNAFTFDGVNDYVQFPDNAFNSLTGSFSVSAWFKTPSSIQAVSNIIFNNRSGNTWFNNPNGFILSQYGNGILFDLYNNTNSYTQLRPSYTFSPNTWYHITATKLVNGNMKVYINGELIGTLVTTVNPTYLATVSKPCIGVDLFGSKAADYFAQNGFAVDALSVWNKELTASEVSSLYNGGTGAQYPFSGQTLATSNDAIGTNHGTLMNGCTFATGKIGKAFTFDGVNDYVALPDNSLNFTGKFSYSFWIKATDTTGYTVIVGNIQGARAPYGFGHGYNFWLQYGKITIGFRNGMDSTSYGLDSVATVANGLWNHVVITYKYTPVNTDGAKIYINGVLDSSRSVPNSTNFYSSPMKACIGARNQAGAPEYFLSNGTSLDALSAWNKELTAAEVTELYNSGSGKQYPNY